MYDSRNVKDGKRGYYEKLKKSKEKKEKEEKVNVAQNSIIRGQSEYRPRSGGEKFNMMYRDVIHSYIYD